ncbi:MAG: hypothetical protein JRF33_19705 [Deltaproteobacteria bacterium]|nr:hypothetical protein [Deltaproteobacteria bacterium]
MKQGDGQGLVEPIVNRYRRRKKKGSAFWLSLAGIVFLFVLVVVLRLWMLTGFPWVRVSIVERDDNLVCLRGAMGLLAPEQEAESWLKAGIDEAFQAKLEFLGILTSSPDTLRPQAADAPLAVLVGQQVVHEAGQAAFYGLDSTLGQKDWDSPSVFRVVRHLKGWGLLDPGAYPENEGRQWQGREPDAVQLLPAAQAPSLGFGDTLMASLGGLFDARAKWLHLARRPTAQLVSWDTIARTRHTLGLCGQIIDDAGAWSELAGQPLTHLLVRKGFGPYDKREVYEALRAGHHFCALPSLGDATAFRFRLVSKASGEELAMMGDSLVLPKEGGAELLVDVGLAKTPVGLRVHLLADGEEVAAGVENKMKVSIERGGAYRVEVGIMGGDFPWGESEHMWIYSNPIRIGEKH